MNTDFDYETESSLKSIQNFTFEDMMGFSKILIVQAGIKTEPHDLAQAIITSSRLILESHEKPKKEKKAAA